MEIAGGRVNSVYFHNDDGYFYRKNYVQGRTLYVTCVEKDCKGRGKINLDVAKDDRRVVLSKEHIIQGTQHLPDFEKKERLKLMETLKRQAAVEPISLRALFDRECERNPVGAVTVGFGAVESTLYKRKRTVVPQIPATMDHFANLMEQGAIGERYGKVADGAQRVPFFRGLLEGEDGSRTAVFSTPDMCAALAAASELHVDATFKVVPRAAGLYQLFSVHAAVGDHTFPVVFGLMTRKTKLAYNLLFDFIRTVLAPSMAPISIMSDYETELMAALRESFPDASISGCWFHYANALWGRCQRLGLTPFLEADESAAKAVRMAMVLPLLPANRIPEGFAEVINFCEEAGIRERMEDFLHYVDTTWLQGIGCITISVHRKKRRTNNNVESFHSTLLNKIGQAHPSFWVFIDKLAFIASVEAKELQRQGRGLQLRRQTKAKYLANNKTIKNAVNRLEGADHPRAMADFLEAASYAVGGVASQFRRLAARGGYRQEPAPEPAPPAPAPAPPAPVPAPPAPVPAPPAPARARECFVCHVEEPTHVVLPCFHMGLCVACVNVLEGMGHDTCPYCRAPDATFKLVFAL